MHQQQQQQHEPQNSSEMERMHNKERRLLYFSDGTMMVGGDGELDEDAVKDVTDGVEEAANLSLFKSTANKILAGIDYVGGGIADFLGITTPKYASEIEYYKQEAIKKAETDFTDNGNDVALRSYERTNSDEGV